MAGESYLLNPSTISNCSGNNSKDNSKKSKEKKRKKNKRGGSKKKMSVEQALAFKSVSEWVFLDQPSSLVDDFGIQKSFGRGGSNVVFELHSHSKRSDGFLSPSKLVERAHANGVKVLALTDHDTMSGIPEALESARKYGIKIIPGVEISTTFSSSGESDLEEPVHILAYYSCCGPTMYDEVDKFLENIRDGRYLRAQNMVLKLNKLKLPLKWDHVTRIAGKGVAPGRLHVARAMVEAGYVENLKQAFARYLFDGGPAYATGSEPPAEEAVRLICKTRGLAVLAHPWALKNPMSIIRRLKEAGLHGLEVYRSDGKLSGLVPEFGLTRCKTAAYSDMADTFGLLKVGGSDFHGKGGSGESALGSVNLPVVAIRDFLQAARPIWCSAIRGVLDRYAEEPTDSNLAGITRFGHARIFKGDPKDFIDCCLTSWLTKEERENAEFEAITLKISHISDEQGGDHQVKP